MDDDIFKHLLDSENLLKIRADDIREKKGLIEGYRKEVVSLREALETAESELESSASEFSQVKYQQQTKSRQLELITDKLRELREEVQSIVSKKSTLSTKRDTARTEYRAKVAHYSALFTTECEGLECCDEGVRDKMRCIEADILARQADSEELERERLTVQCNSYNIKGLEDARNAMLTKRRELPAVVQQPHANAIQQLERNIAKFEREIKMMSGEVQRMRQHSGVQQQHQNKQQPQHSGHGVQQPQHTQQQHSGHGAPQPQDDRSCYQSAPHSAPYAVPQSFKENKPPQAPPNLGFRSATNHLVQASQYNAGRFVVPSVSPYFTPNVVKTCNPGQSGPPPAGDDMYDDGIVDDDLLELCKTTDMLN